MYPHFKENSVSSLELKIFSIALLSVFLLVLASKEVGSQSKETPIIFSQLINTEGQRRIVVLSDSPNNTLLEKKIGSSSVDFFAVNRDASSSNNEFHAHVTQDAFGIPGKLKLLENGSSVYEIPLPKTLDVTDVFVTPTGEVIVFGYDKVPSGVGAFLISKSQKIQSLPFLKRAEAIALSEDGEQLAFSQSVAVGGDSQIQLFVCNLDGQNQQQVYQSSGPGFNYGINSIYWNGKDILFSQESAGSGSTDIFQVNTESGITSQLMTQQVLPNESIEGITQDTVEHLLAENSPN